MLRIVEPYSVVEIEYIAEQLGQGWQEVETKRVYPQPPVNQLDVVDRLSQMILDKVLDGVLDQGRGCLILFNKAESDVSALSTSFILQLELRVKMMYTAAIETLGQVGKVVESLYAKVRVYSTVFTFSSHLQDYQACVDVFKCNKLNACIRIQCVTGT